MMKKIINSRFIILFFCLFLIALSACSRIPGASAGDSVHNEETPIRVGAERTGLYFNLLEGKKIAVAGNHSSLIGNTHLVDSLLAAGFDIQKVFSPEHGFRGTAAAGEYVDSERDPKTGLPIISLYGSNRRPTKEQLEGLDLIIFDIQDVGARFYTYISTLSLIMKEAARMNIPMIILDRPNPNGHFIDGPVLDLKYGSFVGMHPVPVVHGMTIGEYAMMVNGEAWLGHNLKTDLTIIPIENYTHSHKYDLPVPPSPNLPNMRSVFLYPSLCFFEGTQVSLGRGTPKPFQVYGHSSFDADKFDYSFVPQSVKAAPDPPQLDLKCYGRDLSEIPPDSLNNLGRIDLSYLIEAFSHFPQKDKFFNNFFDLLAGTSLLRNQLLAGISEEKIRESWQKDLESFRKIRSKYLLYPDFE